MPAVFAFTAVVHCAFVKFKVSPKYQITTHAPQFSQTHYSSSECTKTRFRPWLHPGSCRGVVSLLHFSPPSSDVKSSRPDCPRGRNFVLGLDKLSSASSSSSGFCPRPRGVWPRSTSLPPSHLWHLNLNASILCASIHSTAASFSTDSALH